MIYMILLVSITCYIVNFLELYNFWSILALKRGFDGLEIVLMYPVTMIRHQQTCVNTNKPISGVFLAPQLRKVMFPITVQYFWIST